MHRIISVKKNRIKSKQSSLQFRKESDQSSLQSRIESDQSSLQSRIESDQSYLVSNSLKSRMKSNQSSSQSHPLWVTLYVRFRKFETYLVLYLSCSLLIIDLIEIKLLMILINYSSS